MSQQLDGYIGDEHSSKRQHGLMTWPALLAIGWLLYELTAQPNLGAAIVCAKFGWNDFRAALWLRRIDPHRRRARACFWFYLASGLWKMAITATLTIFAFAFLVASLQPRAPGGRAKPPPMPFLPPWFYGVMLTALMGFGLSALTTLIALALASRYRIKFWLSANVHKFRRLNRWPPYDVHSAAPNQAGRILLTALILMIAPAVLAVCVMLGMALARFGPVGVMSIVLLAMGVCPVSIMVLRDMLMANFVARTPSECWRAVEVESESSVVTDY
jgi:hypothetical protein